ncbi:ROK family transcriptional regulator [Streptomyces sp.]|uniref:ROK family transcriptional regulator n=1 Tax=Streptomyces sp. TaxID=1931 RepID=UPI002D7A3FF6|nr:ROK family transcriptional regulator [Streptomyces sp.]HET6354646.1 ROK family transcriptional regulator [Streptomyces sp.]
MPSSMSSRRQRTQDQVLAVLAEHGALTRADLSHLTGLSRSAVASAVTLLADQELIDENPIETGAATRGRRPTTVELRQRSGIVLAIDFGHAHITTAVATTSGDLLAETATHLDVDSHPQEALDTATDLATQALAQGGGTPDQITGIAAGIPGPLDIHTQVVRAPTILREWTGLNPAEELSRRLGHPVTVANDADMGARGEHMFGAARNINDFLYIKASHGIGAGLVLGGRTYRGSTGIAGEIGHTRLQGANNWCRCGNRGCLETVVSITEVRQQLAHVLAPDHPVADGDLPPLADLAPHPAAARVITDAGRTIGLVLADLVNCLNPAAIILGGDLGTAGEPLAQGVRESINRYAQPASAHAVTIACSTLQQRSELLGAVATAIHHNAAR